MRLAVVVQRYGADINGGAELHARYIAERLSRHAEVEVVTTCARDYVTWRNERPAGIEEVNGVRGRRFPVAHERKPEAFGQSSRRVFEHAHSLAEPEFRSAGLGRFEPGHQAFRLEPRRRRARAASVRLGQPELGLLERRFGNGRSRPS